MLVVKVMMMMMKVRRDLLVSIMDGRFLLVVVASHLYLC